MLDPLNATNASQIAADASTVEQSAIEKDRSGDVNAAISLYNQVASKLSAAAAQLPVNHPDAKTILNHRIEVLRRIDYLQSLFPGQTPSIPVENHIQPVQVALGSRPNTPSKSAGGSSNTTLAASAAIGGIGGLILLGPVTAVAGAVGLAYAATRQDAVGTTVRAVADSGVAVGNQAAKLDQKHGITTKAKVFAVTAFNRTKELDEKYHVTSTVKSGIVTAATKISETNEKYKITDRVASGISSGFSTLTGWISGTPSQPPPPPGTR